MQVNKYIAKSIREATEKVKEVLGPDAMIISTKQLRGNGRNRMFEIAAVPSANESSREEAYPLREVRSELISLKEMISLLNYSNGFMEKVVMNPYALKLYARLIKNGVNDQYARVFLERTGIFSGSPSHENQDIVEKTIKEIMRVIGVKDPFESEGQKPVVTALIGTTGVGKTTTIAKLAARLMLKANKKIGFISLDTYRIGAMDQLKIYANILGIPCLQAFKKKDLHLALKRLEGKDLILIDTAGQSQYNLSRIEELRQLLADYAPIRCHLLLSVATTEAEMHRTAVNFSPLQYQSFIFTKVDEAETCGSVLNQIMRMDFPISYFTTGQNVPEDIEKAEKEKIVRLLFNRN